MAGGAGAACGGRRCAAAASDVGDAAAGSDAADLSAAGVAGDAGGAGAGGPRLSGAGGGGAALGWDAGPGGAPRAVAAGVGAACLCDGPTDGGGGGACGRPSWCESPSHTPGSFWEPRARRAPRVRLHSKQFWVCGVTPPPRIEGAEEPRVLCHGSRQHRSDAPDSHVWMSGRRRIFERQTSRPVAFASPAVGRGARAGDSAELYLCSPDNTSDPEGLTTQRLIEGVSRR